MREPVNFRDQYQLLVTRFPGREAISIKDSEELLGLGRRALLSDKTFPAKKVGGHYIVPLAALAKWLV